MKKHKNTTLLLSSSELAGHMRSFSHIAENSGHYIARATRFIEKWGYVCLGMPAITAHGMVMKARHALLGTTRGVKLFFFDDSTARTRFKTEASLHAECEHPSVLRIFDALLDDTMGGLALEWAGNGSFRTEYDGNPEPRLENAVSRMVSIAYAVRHIHACGVLHCDLKPDNILLTEGNVPKIADFGSALCLPFAREGNAPVFLSGTPLSMAPEIMCGGTEVDTRADVYSLGVILFYCLTGCYPHAGRQPSVLLRRKMEERTPSLREFRPSLDNCDSLDAIIRKTLSADPEDRYFSAGQFAQALECWSHSSACRQGLPPR